MGYQSLTFVAFIFGVAFVYYLVPRRGQRWVLAVSNLLFYLIAGIEYLPFLLATTLATYFAARKIGAVYQQSETALVQVTDAGEKKQLRAIAKKRAKRVLVITLLVVLGLLAVCKYALFFRTNANMLLSLFGSWQIPLFRMILPIGISFYTFMAVSYLLDIYWKRYAAERNFLTYAVYLSYFPHVVQGPIDRFSEFAPQIRNGVALDYRNLTRGAQLLLWGYFKKLVIADRLGIFIDTVLADWQQQNGLMLMLVFLLYSVQIYADFSGCIDIVSGGSEMLGIHLRKNFDHPYFSKTMPEFWRRWHISLQEWFKDYLYFPVSASNLMRKVKKRLKAKNHKQAEEIFTSCFPILVVWLVTGIWHGAAWKYVAWGLFHAALLIGGRIFAPVFTAFNTRLKINTQSRGWKLWQIVRTFLLCSAGRIFFRAGGLLNALQLIGAMLTNSSLAVFTEYDIFGYGLDLHDWIVAVVAMGILLVADLMQEHFEIRDKIAKQPLVVRWSIWLGGMLIILIFGLYGPRYSAANFIYEQF